jgi:3-phenylpropionate/trans-cinnamate dioxygenase ferredoxin reductase component
MSSVPFFGVVIVGGGQAGLEAAAGLRTQGYEGTVTLICEEPHAPYQRPPLSKDFLTGKQEVDRVFLRNLAYYEKQRIDLLLDERVTEINAGAKMVYLAGGGTVPYAHLILAVGARNRALPAPGAENVLYLRSLDEAVTLKQRLAEARHGVAVIGGGFIGLEVAAAARMAGKPVTVIEAAPRLMARAVSPVLSKFFLELHRAQGTEVLLNTVAVEVRPDAVILPDGRRIAADLVVAGIGVIPNVELARAAGLEVNDGIMVDEYLRTVDPAIFAIGDCAEHPNVFAGGRARLESVQNAADQARCVARFITGQPEPYRDVPWFWTDQFEIRFQMAGLSTAHDQSVLRGGIERGKFSAFYFKQGRLLAVDSVNRVGDHVTARKMLAAGTPLTPEQAADETVDLKQLAAAQRAG